MKRQAFFSKIFLIVLLSTLSVTKILACEIFLEVVSEQKDTYKRGEEIIVKVKIYLAHKNCPVDIRQTYYKPTGLEILGATDWKEVSPGVWERKLKLKVIADKAGTASLNISRSCEKEGGSNTLYFNIK